MKTLSHDNHNKTDYLVKTLEDWKLHNKCCSENAFNNSELKIKTLLDNHPDVRDYAIDIGSGAGWMSNELSKYFQQVIAIEPSLPAIEICKKLYPQENIMWIQGYAEDVIRNIEFESNSKYFINTCSVFIHMDDECVSPILKIINEKIRPGILSLQEFWSETRHFNEGMGNCRTKKWWEKELSNWALDFHGPDMSPHGEFFKNINKGIHGICC